MPGHELSRRSFLSASAAAGAAVMTHPVKMAAQAAGVKSGDLPDLTIKEAKIYVLDSSSWRNAGAGLSGGDEIASMVTASGIEGNFTLGNGAGGVRTPPGSWVDFAKANCVGKNLFDILPTVSYIPLQNQPGGGGGAGAAGAAGGGRGGAVGAAAAASGGAAAGTAPAAGRGGGGRGGGDFIGGFNPGFRSRQHGTGTPGPNAHASACDFILWDIMGKAVNRPIYKILGGSKEQGAGLCEFTAPGHGRGLRSGHSQGQGCGNQSLQDSPWRRPA